MSLNTNVVDGEASESDSEIEVGKSPDVESPSNLRSFVISGEAPESDEVIPESKLPSPTQNAKDLDKPLHVPFTQQSSPMKMAHGSILHQKLWECNVSLRATMEGLLKHTTEISVEKLSSADKTLLSVQESMRATNASLTLARARLKQIHFELEKANCGACLPSVKVKTGPKIFINI